MSKLGAAKYISHLDFMRTARRAFIRAGIPLRYSEGFNPHPLMSFALPLSVGQESVCELLDFELAGEMPPDALKRLAAALPEGITATEMYSGGQKPGLLRWLEVSGRLHYDGGVPAGAIAALEAGFAAEHIFISLKTKRGEAETDIAPMLRGAAFSDAAQGVVAVNAVISAQNPTLNPNALAAAATAAGYAPDFAEWRRAGVYDADMKVFR
ncbi:MAG: TIGR03936 family radical SAM-associated protein [Oscillospiraceae bacterium]|jgi:radical SAM-linked protein|nr:TIGR03936 family radical SAM-associated protein [Oscillospiraceae bacterium]